MRAVTSAGTGGLLFPSGVCCGAGAAAFEHDGVPALQLVPHLLRQLSHCGLEPFVHGGFPVVFEQARGCADFQEPKGLDSDSLQADDVGGAQRCPGSVLQAKRDR